ncbi:cobalamin B12-binding domain-containing protein [Dendrosporobacter sp. 1207_IL3150]|uniref:cobalamin B12-binding domain-containing protein n=1 Tax=Dendrosporobacter sp. 1207_IL3150 TaxID=3084054 RepID=UPI002FDA8372
MLLIEDIRSLPPVSNHAALQYELNHNDLRLCVSRNMEHRTDIKELIGFNELSAMQEFHLNHARFMVNVLHLNSFELLGRVFIWVYRAYRSHGYSYEYFPIALSAWKDAINHHIEAESAAEIIAVYDWLIKKHDIIINIVESGEYKLFSMSGEWQKEQANFLNHLLNGDYKGCLAYPQKYVSTEKDLMAYYMDIIQPTMYELGHLWQTGKISIAEEHLATAIVTRLMLVQYMKLPGVVPAKGKAIITAAPNEFHEIGARMASDLLELDGWNVAYLGANTPVHDLIELVKRERPTFIGISVVIPFNLLLAQKVIRRIKSDPDICNTKIIVGGSAFLHDDTLWRLIGADAIALDCQEILKLASSFAKGITNE